MSYTDLAMETVHIFTQDQNTPGFKPWSAVLFTLLSLIFSMPVSSPGSREQERGLFNSSSWRCVENAWRLVESQSVGAHRLQRYSLSLNSGIISYMLYVTQICVSLYILSLLLSCVPFYYMWFCVLIFNFQLLLTFGLTLVPGVNHSGSIVI